MADAPELTTREASQRSVRLATRVLAVLALLATAAFGAAAASTARHTSTADQSSADVVQSASWDDGYDDGDTYGGFGLNPPSQGLLPGGGGAMATSGGS